MMLTNLADITSREEASRISGSADLKEESSILKLTTHKFQIRNLHKNENFSFIINDFLLFVPPLVALIKHFLK